MFKSAKMTPRNLLLAALTLVSACSYKADFRGDGEALKALDATYGTGAQIRNMPKDPSNATSLNAEVFGNGVTIYMFALVEGDQSCEVGKYSDTRPITKEITGDLGADGRKKLCVRGAGSDTSFQTRATEYSWTKDTEAPGSFDFVGLSPFTNEPPQKVSWTEAEGAAFYKLEIGNDKSCTKPSKSSKTKESHQDIDLSEDGVYFLCLSAVDEAGNTTIAEQSPFRLEIDRKNPGSFAINYPASFTNLTTPTIKWSLAEDASEYHVILATDSTCDSQVETSTVTESSYTIKKSLTNAVSYFVCVSASDVTGNEIAASNNGYKFTVDTAGLTVTFDPATLPSNPSKNTTLNVKVISSASDFTGYRYALGKDTLDCLVESNYSIQQPLSKNITNSTSGYTDGTLKLCAIGVDQAGNWTDLKDAVIYTWRKDTKAPVLSMTMDEIFGPRIASNISTKSGSVVDTNGAVASITGIIKTGTSCLTAAKSAFQTCPAQFPIAFSNGAFSFDIAKSVFSGKSGLYAVTVTAVDSAGNSASATESFTWDETKPVVDSFALMGKPETSRPYTTASFKGTDRQTNITQYCFISSIGSANATPGDSDRCWVPFSSSINTAPALSLNIASAPFVVGFVPEDYIGQLWLKDAANNISAIATDTIKFNPGTVPELTDVIASGSNSPANPPSIADRTVAAGQKVYIKWVARDADKSLPAKAISLQYTNDEINWNDVPGAKDLPPGVNGTCSAPSRSLQASLHEVAGCFVWNSLPINGYTRVRVAVTDQDGQVTFSTAPVLNLAGVNFLAGNTEVGIGASARSTVFQNFISVASTPDTQSLVITSKGEFIFRDFRRGIMRVRPDTGVLEMLIPNKSTAPIDDVAPAPIATAGLIGATAIAIDYQDRVLVLDRNRVRRIDLNAMTIETLAGGANSATPSSTAATVSNAKDLYINADGGAGTRTIYALPSGKIMFVSENRVDAPNNLIRIYDPITKSISSRNFTGEFSFSTTGQIYEAADCRSWNRIYSFNPATEALTGGVTVMWGVADTRYVPKCQVPSSYKVRFRPIDVASSKIDNVSSLLDSSNLWGQPVVGLDGSIYYADRLGGRIHKYDPATRGMNILAGTGVPGSCVDGTHPLSCSLDPQDVFVAINGRMFFLDRGRVRTIEGSGAAAKVVTVMGQAIGYGDGENALSARFSEINRLGIYTSNATRRIVLLDNTDQVFREAEVGGKIKRLSGTGTRGQTQFDDPSKGFIAPPADTQPLALDSAGHYFDDYEVMSNGDIYYKTDRTIIKLNRAVNRWQAVSGTGNTWWRTAADGTLGTQINFASSHSIIRLLGTIGDRVVASLSFYDSTRPQSDAFVDQFFFEVKQSDGAIKRIAGKAGPVAKTEAEFLAGCAIGGLATNCQMTNNYTGPYAAMKILSRANGSAALVFANYTKNLYTIEPDGKIQNYDTVSSVVSGFAIKQGNGTTPDTLYYCGNGTIRKKTVGVANETVLSIGPSSQVRCDGRDMHWDGSRLVFIYTLNNMNGVAEYVNP